MKATIERATLLRCLSHVQSVVERRNTIPILSNVLIDATPDGTLRVMATDLDIQVVEYMAAVSVDGPGAITVSAHLLFDIARKLQDGSQVSLQTVDNRLVVKAGRSRFQLPTLPRDDFPVIVEGDLPTSFELPAATLAIISGGYYVLLIQANMMEVLNAPYVAAARGRRRKNVRRAGADRLVGAEPSSPYGRLFKLC